MLLFLMVVFRLLPVLPPPAFDVVQFGLILPFLLLRSALGLAVRFQEIINDQLFHPGEFVVALFLVLVLLETEVDLGTPIQDAILFQPMPDGGDVRLLPSALGDGYRV